jgi:hypothetical protein
MLFHRAVVLYQSYKFTLFHEPNGFGLQACLSNAPLSSLTENSLGSFNRILHKLSGGKILTKNCNFLDFRRTDRVLKGKALQGILLDT